MTESDNRRARSLLKSYYGIGKSEASTPVDPLNLDAIEFDPDGFFKKLINEKDLQELLREDSKVHSEIRALDGDMKTLVYENYSKFISATEMIKKMKQNVENMESEMEKLRANMGKISEGSAKINTSLVQKRDRINQLGGVHSLLKRLQFVFELPSKLRKCLDMQAYGQAYKFYTKTTNILKHYNHLPSFANIQSESDAIMRELAVKLKKKLVNETTKSNELSECVRILLGLKETPEKLWKDYLQYAARELKKSLKNAEKECDKLKPEVRKVKKSAKPEVTGFVESDDETASVKSDQISQASARTNEPEEEEVTDLIVEPIKKLSVLNDTFLKEFTDFVASFVSLFVKHEDTNANILSEENLQRAEQDLLNVVDEIAQIYFSLIETKCLNLDSDPNYTPSPFSFVEVLSRMFKDTSVLDAASPHARLAARNRSVTSNFLLKYMDYMFEQLETHAKNSLTKIVTQLQPNSDNLNGFVKPFCNDFIDTAKKILSNLEVFIQSGAKFMGEHTAIFTHDIMKKSGAFWSSLVHSILELGSRPSSNVQDALPFIITKIFLEFETSVTSAFFLYIADTFSPTGRKALAQEAKEAIKTSKEYAQKMLDNYVELTGQKFTVIIRASIESKDWMGKKEPRKVSVLWGMLVSDMNAIQKYCDQLFPDDATKRPGSDSSRSRTRPQIRGVTTGVTGKGNPFGENFLNNIDKLFSDQIEIFGKVDFKKSSIMMAIVKITIKTLIECLRLCTFSKAGFQQIQVDIEYLRINLWKFVIDERLLSRLLDDVLTSVQTRSVEPAPLEQSIVQKLVGESASNQTNEQQ